MLKQPDDETATWQMRKKVLQNERPIRSTEWQLIL